MANNPKQNWDSKSYQSGAGFVPLLGKGVLDLLNAQPDEHILDLGCGDGVLTLALKNKGAIVKGIDPSPSFVQSASERGLDAEIGDGQNLKFDSQFDAVFSNAALHWMPDHAAVCDGVFRALKPKGRFVAEFGGFGNCAAIVSAMTAVAHSLGGDAGLASVWNFPTLAHFEGQLRQAGFTDCHLHTFYRPTPLPNGMEAWLMVMRRPFFEQFGDRQDEAMNLVLQALKPTLCDENGQWMADYVRLQFSARKP